MTKHNNETERNDLMKKVSFVKGTFIGALIGAVAGILLAPKSGRETQDDIKRKVRGTYHDVQGRLEKMSVEMNGRVETLKEAAKDLKGEAREESQELIRRAEVLKQDLRISANNMAKTGTQTKDSTVKQVKLLLGEGSDVLSELERVTRHLAGSTKERVSEGLKGESRRHDHADHPHHHEDGER
jgi:gas vesicle protein